ncbi:MAG TPA: cation diffusion facilitator family transporter, partial [Microthrixaceae bacterium]|nr:cation diffusion facilitator family transporter [Microthrixaceae bacterium]
MAHDHSHAHGSHLHGPAARAGARHQRPLAMAFGLVVAFLVVQVVAGLVTGSLALLSDAGHMATDAIGIGMALAAIHLASRTQTRSQRTFGLYRLEILAALANSVLLFGVAIYVLVEAAIRLGNPEEVPSLTVLAVATIGLFVNLVSFRLLRAGAAESLNVEGAYVEVLADLLGSIGVMVAASVMWLTGWEWVDPVVGAA